MPKTQAISLSKLADTWKPPGPDSFLAHPFPRVPFLFYDNGMIDSPFSPAEATDISAAILSSPGWARLGIAAPSEQLREKAALELALSIVEHLNPPATDAGDQLPLL